MTPSPHDLEEYDRTLRERQVEALELIVKAVEMLVNRTERLSDKVERIRHHLEKSLSDERGTSK